MMVFKLFDLEKIIKKINRRNFDELTKLNLGAGDDIREGWFNHDQVSGDSIDYTFNLNNPPYPVRDSEFDVVYASHVLEHITEIFPCVQEIYRILKKDGLFVVRVPHYSSNCCYGDLSHRRASGYETFQHLANSNYCHLYGINKWSSVEFCKLYFAKKWYYPWNYIIEPLANLKPIYFENVLANIFTPFETVTILRK